MYDGSTVDLYSFGIFLYELMPKKGYSHPDSMVTTIEMLKTITPLNEHNRIYENLIVSCLKSTSKDRSKAVTKGLY
jgi:serine/threonine protein kinase